nr:(S)-2-haloacid dehalogenase [Cupriavidus sp.]
MVQSNSSPRVIAFDAYGTLFDVYAITAQAESYWPGQGTALAKVWRDKQIEYTRLRSMAGPAHYKSFWLITIDSLRFAAQSLGLAMSSAQEQGLLDQYAVLKPFPENLATLQTLKARGSSLCILSNGSPEMLASAVSSANMDGLFDAVLSAESVRRFKVDASVYQLVCDRFSCSPAEVLMVSSNCWDMIGAHWFGFHTFWVNRSAQPLEQLDATPDYQGESLTDLLNYQLR